MEVANLSNSRFKKSQIEKEEKAESNITPTQIIKFNNQGKYIIRTLSFLLFNHKFQI